MLIELNIITIHYINSVRIVNAHYIIYIYFYCRQIFYFFLNNNYVINVCY